GSANVEGIFLNLCEIRGSPIKLTPTFFIEMYNLRLLQILGDSTKLTMEQSKLQLPKGLDTLPDSLRYLHWLYYPLNSLPSNFMPQNLVELNLSSSQLKQLSNEFELLENLKVVNLSCSKILTQIPEISRANLKSLCLKDCESIVEIPSLKFEKALDKKCSTKENVGAQIYTGYGSTSMRPTQRDHRPYWWESYEAIDYFLNLSGCSNLKVLSELSGSIKYISLHSTSIEELNSSIWSLDNLSLLDLSNCKFLKNLPSGIGELGSLSNLYLDGCSSFDSFPKHLPKNVISLDFSGTKIKHVPSLAIENLSSLEDLCLKNCQELETLPATICKLRSLVSLDLSDCSKLNSFPKILEPMECLKTLYLDRSGITKLHSSIEKLVALEWLILMECKNLEFVPINIYNMSHLKVLCLSKCSKLESLPSVTTNFQFKIEVDLSYNNIVKVRDWNLGLSPLPLLGHEPYRSMVDHRQVSIEQLSNLVLYLMEPCDNGDTFTALDFDDVFSCRCLLSSIQKRNELVELCLNQSEGSSIDIYLSPFSYNSNFTGFYFCVIIEFDNYCFDINRLSFECEYHFENNNGESNKRSWSFRTTAKNTSTVTEIGILNSDHMFMGFIHEEYDENLASCPILQVSFKFHLQQHDWEEVVNVGNYKVKKCGICPLNLEHLVEVFNNLDDHDSSENNESEEMEIGMEDINSIFDNINNNVTYYREKQVTISEAHTIIPLELW
ncbi:hypothetical protein G4B88_004584, partial [Cannabis sativa]